MLVSRRTVSHALVSLPIAAAMPRPSWAQDTDLRLAAEAARAARGLPALALMSGKDGVVLDQLAIGLRARGATATVTTGDRWHIGSCAKAMTATLIARLVERGLMNWNSPLAELLPDLAPSMHPVTARITLYELMTMRSGLPGNPSGGFTVGQIKGGLQAIQAGAADDRSRRLLVAERMLPSAPKKTPGSVFAYSNTSYILLGAIIEQATNDSYDRQIGKEIFAPLAIDDFGFGAPGINGDLDQPRGHEPRANGAPIDPQSANADLPSFMRPAGGINMTLAAWSRFVADHIVGERGRGTLLSPTSYVRLHTTPGPGFPYAGGWGVSNFKGRRVLSHVGNNTRFTAYVQAFPETGHTFLYASNDGRDSASVKAFLTVQAGLATTYLANPPAA